MAHNNHFSLSDSEQLSDPSVLTEHLYSGAASVRSSGDPSGLARLLEAAAQAVQRQAAEARVQRGLAIASQTIASELALKCEQLQQRIDGSAGEGAYTTDPRSIPSLTTNSALPPSRSSPKTGPQSVGSPHAGPQTCSPSTAPPPPSTLPARCGPPSTPATYPAPQQPQHAQTQAAVSPVGNALPSYAAQASCSVPARSSINEGAVDRLEPRSFKTWVQDTPQTGAQGNACIGSAPRQLQESPKAPDAEIERQVDTMVENLKLRFKQSGVTLPLEKHSGCVYRLGSRKLSLSLRNGRLMVRVGGGYCDFLEYLSKATL